MAANEGVPVRSSSRGAACVDVYFQHAGVVATEPDRFTEVAQRLLDAWHKAESALLDDPAPDDELQSELRFNLVAGILSREFGNVDKASVWLVAAAMPSIFADDYLSAEQVASLAGVLRSLLKGNAR